jgi:hypothetical protein
MQNLSKFRSWGGKIKLMNDYTFDLNEKIKPLGQEPGTDLISQSLENVQSGFEEGKDYLLEVYYDNGDLVIDKKQLWPENEDKVLKGEKVDWKELGAEKAAKNLIWLKKDGYLYSFEGKINDILAIYCLKYLEQKLPAKEVKFDSKLFTKELKQAEEAFWVDSELGIKSIYRFGRLKIGNSRFYAKFLRNMLAEVDSAL